LTEGWLCYAFNGEVVIALLERLLVHENKSGWIGLAFFTAAWGQVLQSHFVAMQDATLLIRRSAVQAIAVV
jgi:hypothetical protein